MDSNHRKIALVLYFDDGTSTVAIVCRYIMRQKALVFRYFQLIIFFSHSTWEMVFFVILIFAITLRSITVDCEFRNFLDVVEAVTESEEVSHLHFLI